MNIVKLSNWSVRADAYQAPEVRKSYLVGIVHGHHRKADGICVTTSHIASTNKRVITTGSGTVYRLGKIDPKYRKFLKEHNIPYDPHDPIKIVDKFTEIKGNAGMEEASL